MSENRPIILVEDDARDLELTLAVMERYSLHNPIIVARDGVEALTACTVGMPSLRGLLRILQ